MDFLLKGIPVWKPKNEEHLTVKLLNPKSISLSGKLQFEYIFVDEASVECEREKEGGKKVVGYFVWH